MSTKKKAVVLVSGGLDSATCLGIAKNRGYETYALSFNYGQRSISELAAAKRITDALACAEHKTLSLDMGQFGGSALTDSAIDVPTSQTQGIPITYVPARNTVFIANALAWAEVLNASAIFIGVNALDYSGYPDCRPEYVAAFQTLIDLATKSGVEGHKISLESPLIDLSKADIIKLGTGMGIDYKLTVSCYQADAEGAACGVCDSCRLRKKGFDIAQMADQTVYQ